MTSAAPRLRIDAQDVASRAIVGLALVAGESPWVAGALGAGGHLAAVAACSAVLSAFGLAHLGSARTLVLDVPRARVAAGGRSVALADIASIECIPLDSRERRGTLLVIALGTGEYVPAGPFDPADASSFVDEVAERVRPSGRSAQAPLRWFVGRGTALAVLGFLASCSWLARPELGLVAALAGATLPLVLLGLTRTTRATLPPEVVPRTMQRWELWARRHDDDPSTR